MIEHLGTFFLDEHSHIHLVMRQSNNLLLGNFININKGTNTVERTYEEIIVVSKLGKVATVIKLPVENVDCVPAVVQLFCQIVVDPPMRPLRIAVDQDFGALRLCVRSDADEGMDDVALNHPFVEPGIDQISAGFLAASKRASTPVLG